MNESTQSTLKVGTILNEKWVILEFIARGGMGEVYRAHQINLKRDVAIKVISREWISCIAGDEEEVETALQRFEHEVHAMARIRHPNVLQIFDFGSDTVDYDGESKMIQYIAMEYIPGNTLRETMSEQGFDPEEDLTRDWLTRYFLPMLDGVEAIHKSDMVHRDMKPENFLLDGAIPKISDFGIARSCRWRAVTNSLDIKGTIMYMPPEQFADFRRTDSRADIYSLGKILYEAIEGKIGSKDKHIHFKSVSLENPETPFFKELDKIIRRATAEEKDDRFDSVEEFRNQILHALSISNGTESGKTGGALSYPFARNPRWIWAGIVVAVLSVGLMTIWHLLGEPGIFSQSPSEEPPKSIQRPAAPESAAWPEVPNRSINTEDGSTMLYIKSGELFLPETTGPDATIDSFYMDETPVTNQQYVQFLNQVSAEVENDVVLGEGNIWLILGEVMEGYDPIAYKNGRFVITHSGHSACPVLRVTAFGARAYAEFYGKRLPTHAEWLYVYRKGNGLSNYESSYLPIPTPVILFDKNRFGIRGLNQSISEWAFKKENARKPAKGPEFMIMGSVGIEKRGKKGPSAVKRLPWEAFEEVGFRCAKDVEHAKS